MKASKYVPAQTPIPTRYTLDMSFDEAQKMMTLLSYADSIPDFLRSKFGCSFVKVQNFMDAVNHELRDADVFVNTQIFK